VSQKPSIVLVDTSVAIASILEDHDGYAVVTNALTDRVAGLAGHAWFETFSVLTRLPGAARRGPVEVTQALRENFPETRWLPEKDTARLADSLADLGIAGGSVYDALVAMTAIAHGLVLLSRDRRALPTYAALGAHVEVLSE
jgi:predicted nucleic acid-binding protein